MSSSVLALKASVLSWGTAVGKKESEGPLKKGFDLLDPSDKFGQNTWESAESEMQRRAFGVALAKGNLHENDVDLLFAGDLLNQCVGSAYGLLDYDIPFFGLYGACSTSVESLLLASMAVSGGLATVCGAVTSSHYCAAERQFRSPLEYGSQRPPTAQWTVTGSGAFLIGKGGDVSISKGIVGIVRDGGIRDANNMGAAMAPAAAETVLRFFGEGGEDPGQYDAIVTGDLGFEGGQLFLDLLRAQGLFLQNHFDCGQMIYDRKRQDVHSGGSGCGCAASVLGAYWLPRLQKKEIRRILLLATGALMSPDSLKQGKNIPAVAHGIVLEA